MLLSLLASPFAAQAQTCTTKEFLYVNEPATGAVMKFEVTNNVALTEVTGANGGPHWYPGTGISELGQPHGLATDLNGKLYIGESGNTGKLRRLNCDGVLDPVSSATITTQENYTQNIFSIGNIIYHNSTGGPTAYNSCTGAKIGKMCLAGASAYNQWGLSYNPVTELVYATDRGNANVWVFTKGQLEAGIAGNPGTCINPLVQAPGSFQGSNETYGIVGDNNGYFYVAQQDGNIYKYNSSGQIVDQVNIAAHNSFVIGITWSSSTNRLYVSNFNNSAGQDCISVIDASTMTYLGAGISNPPGGSGIYNGSKAIAILKESCPVNLPATFSVNVCGAIGKKFYLNQEAFKGCDGIVCGSSWVPTSMTGMTFDACDNSVTITGEGCGVFTLNTAAVTSSGCPAQTSTFTICNTFPPDITITTQADCTPNGKYTLTGTVTVAGGAPPTGTLTVSVRGGGSQTFNAPFASVINFSIPNITSYGGTRGVYAYFSDNNCSKAQTYTEPTNCPTCTSPLATNVTLSQTAPTCTGITPDNNGKITLTSAANTDKCGISMLNAGTYDGPVYASATAYAANKDVKTAIPNTGGTYILRLYNGSDICYKDTIITIAAVTCACTQPTLDKVSTVAGTCTDSTPNNNATASVSVTDGDKADIVEGATYGSGPAYGAGTNLSVAAGSVSFTGLKHNTQYTIRVWNVDNTCFEDKSFTTASITCCAPPSPTGQGTTICAGSTATISATGCDATYPLKWYSDAGLTTEITTGISGNNLTTAALTTTTDYYAACVKDAACKSAGLKITVTVTPKPAVSGSPAVTQATCNPAGTAANNDAKIDITGITNATVYAYTTNGSDPAFAGATTLTGGVINLTGLANPAGSTTYKFRLFNGSADCYIDLTAVLEPKVCTPTCTPPSPTGQGTTICAGSTATISATGCDATYSLKWYSDAGLTAEITTGISGNNLTTAALTATTDYYAACVKDAACKSAGLKITVTVTPKPAVILSNGFPVCRNNGTAYTIKFTKSPAGAVVTAKNAATGAAITVSGDSVANIALSVAKVRLIVTNGVCKDSIEVDAPVCDKPVGSIGDLIWKDVNDNGLLDLPTEKGVAGVKVNLYAASAGTKTGAVLQTKTTGTDGLYLFTGLLAGDYIIEIDKTTLADTCAITSKQNIPGDDTKDSDFNPTTGLSPVITLAPVFNPTTPTDILATNNLTVDAGLVKVCLVPTRTVAATDPTCAVAGKIELTATNGDKYGLSKGNSYSGPAYTAATTVGALPIVLKNNISHLADSSWTIRVFNQDNTCFKDTTVTVKALVKDATVSVANGFPVCRSNGTAYTIKFTKSPAGAVVTAKNVATNAPIAVTGDSVANVPLTVAKVRLIVTNGVCKDSVDVVAPVCNQPTGSIGDLIWKDVNDNGLLDLPTEKGVAGVKVNLYAASAGTKTGAVLQTKTTGTDGLYLFTGLLAGDYIIEIDKTTLADTCAITAKQNIPSDDTKDSDFNPTTGLSQVITLAPVFNPTTPAEILATNNLTVDAGLVKVCITPTRTVAATDPTCNTAGKIELTATNGDKYGLSKGATYTGPAYAAATAVGTLPILIKGNISYAADSSWTIRVFNKDNTCFKDTTVTVKALVKDATISVNNGFPVCRNNGTTYTIKFTKSPIGAVVTAKNIATGASIAVTGDSVANIAVSVAQVRLIVTNGVCKDSITVSAPVCDKPVGSIGDLIWKDVNDNGLQDLPTEKGIAGVKVNLYAASAGTKTGAVLQTKTTGTDGLYLFTGLLAGDYIIEIDKTTLADTCAITLKQNIPGDDTKDSDFNPSTGLSQVVTLNPVFNPTTPAEILATNNLTVDAGLVVPCAKSKVTVTAAPVCSADVQTYSLSFSVTGKVGTVKVNKGTLTGSNPYTVTGIPSGAAVKITDSLSAVCTFDTLITGPNCNCNPPLPTLITPSLTACIGDTFPTLKATVIGLATVEWFATATSTTVLFTGLNYKPAGTVTAAGAVFYAQARSTDPTCPTAISTGRVMSTVNAQDCTKEVDLALKKSINIKIAQIGDVLTYTLKVWNESTTNATGVEVTDSIATTVQFQTGSFTASRGTASISGKVIKWVIGGIAAGGDTVTLTYRVKATQEGVHFNTAEISKVNEKDIDSTPGNGKEGEDDIDRECFTVPLKLCPGEKAEVNVPAQLTNVQWFKNGGTTAVANGNTVLLSEVGTYTFTATNQACPANGCCPIIIEAGVNCCPEDLCIPFTIKQTKKGKR